MTRARPMSEAATRELSIKRDWAEPGSRHDRLVRLAKVALPVGALGLLALLAISPFDHRSEVSFILDKNKVDAAHERMRIDAARYTGEDNQGRRFSISAERAVLRMPATGSVSSCTTSCCRGSPEATACVRATWW